MTSMLMQYFTYQQEVLILYFYNDVLFEIVIKVYGSSYSYFYNVCLLNQGSRNKCVKVFELVIFKCEVQIGSLMSGRVKQE